MKTTLLLFFTLLFLVSLSTASLSQLSNNSNPKIERIDFNSKKGKQILQTIQNEKNSNQSKKSNLTKDNSVSTFSTVKSERTGGSRANITVIPNNGFFSISGRAPIGSRLFINTRFIVTAAELNASGFQGPVETIGFTYLPTSSGMGPQNIPTTGNLRIYLKDTVASATTVSTSEIDTNGMGGTLVYNGTYSLPTTATDFDIDITTNGAFTPTPGNAVLVTFVYKTTTTLATPLGSPFPSVNGGVAGDNKATLYQSQTAPGQTGAFTPNRPETRFGNTLVDAISVGPIWSLGKTPVCLPCPDTNFVYTIFFHERAQTDTVILNTLIKNVAGGGIKFMFEDTIITTGLEGWLVGNFYPKNTDTKKLDSIISVGRILGQEDITANNRTTYLKQATLNTWNNVRPNGVYDGRVGLGTPGDFVAGYYTPCAVPLCAVNITFFPLTGGNLPYKVKVYGNSGDTVPSNLLYASTQLTSPPGGPTPVKVSHHLPTPVTVGPGYFYVGVEELGGNLGIAFQTESPLRPGTFFLDIPSGADNWFDLSLNAGNIYNIDIEAVTTLNLSLGVYLEGFFNGTSMIPDTVCLVAHKFTPPYVGLDTAYAVVGSNGIGTFSFCFLNNDSCYLYEVRHRNHVATWSHLICERIDECDKIYDFRNNITQAFGSNMIFVPGILDGGGGFAVYTGDVTQEGCVDLADCAAIDNDAFNFVSGYVDTDLNGDLVVDLTDLAYCDNNSFNFVCEVAP